MGFGGVGLQVKGSIEAVEMYKKAFGLELGYHVLNKDGTFFHSELYKEGKEELDVVESNIDPVMENPVQLCFTFSEEEELLNAFHILSEKGRVLMEVCELPWSPCAAEVIDKFGVRWYLTLPQHRPPEEFTPEDCK